MNIKLFFVGILYLLRYVCVCVCVCVCECGGGYIYVWGLV